MSSNSSITITLSEKDVASTFSGKEYWLRLEQVMEDDKATQEEVAETIDELYSVDPCSPESEEEEEEKPPITWDRLMEIAKRRMDIAECARRASGDYTAKVKVIYSKPEDKENAPKLLVTKGNIVSRVFTTEDITLTINVKEQTSITLDYAVLQGADDKEWPGTAKWLGSVFNKESGPIPQPILDGYRNTVFWEEVATGTLLIKIPATYELVTIEVPGIPKVGSLAGETQNTFLRAFWQLRVYELEVTAVNQDKTADGQTLAKLCGWDSYEGGSGSTTGDSSSGDSDSTGDDTTDSSSGPQLGCLEPDEELADPDYYKEICCSYPPPNIALPSCLVNAVARPTKGLAEDVKKSYEDAHNGKVSFVGVGPGPDGCGRQFRTQQVRQRNCCSQLTTELTYDTVKSQTIISRNNYITVYVYGGMRPLLELTIKGEGFWLDQLHRKKKMVVSSSSFSVPIYIYSDNTACGFGEIDIDDGCSLVRGYFQSTSGKWVEIDPWDCELRRVRAQWAWTPGTIPRSHVWICYQDERYQVRQRYFQSYQSYDKYNFGWATYNCDAVPDVDWTVRIDQAKAKRSEVFETYPHIIDMDTGMAVVTHEYLWHWHGSLLNPYFGNTILFRDDAFGGEKVKYEYDYVPQFFCGDAIATVLSTGYQDSNGVMHPDSAEAVVLEWQC